MNDCKDRPAGINSCHHTIAALEALARRTPFANKSVLGDIAIKFMLNCINTRFVTTQALCENYQDCRDFTLVDSQPRLWLSGSSPVILTPEASNALAFAEYEMDNKALSQGEVIIRLLEGRAAGLLKERIRA